VAAGDCGRGLPGRVRRADLLPGFPSWLLDLCRSLSWITWGIFAVDTIVRLSLADERVRYLVRHWYEVLVLALPLLRPLWLLRLIPLLSVLNRQATIRLRGRLYARWRLAAGFLRGPGRT
jgi:voltage-gated potassium channel